MLQRLDDLQILAHGLMEHMLECKEAKKIIGGITGSETIMSEDKEELMTIYNYMEIIFKTLK